MPLPGEDPAYSTVTCRREDLFYKCICLYALAQTKVSLIRHLAVDAKIKFIKKPSMYALVPCPLRREFQILGAVALNPSRYKKQADVPGETLRCSTESPSR